MKPEEVKRLEAAQKTPFPWGEYKGTVLQFVPSKLLLWTATNYKGNDAIATACDLVWNYREDTGTHYEE